MSNVYLTGIIREKLGEAKNIADIKKAFQNPRQFQLVCGLAEFLSERLEEPRLEIIGFVMAAYISIDDLWIGSFTEKKDNEVLNAYPVLSTITRDDYDFLNESARCLATFVFDLPSLADVPQKIDIQSFPGKYMSLMKKTLPG